MICFFQPAISSDGRAETPVSQEEIRESIEKQIEALNVPKLLTEVDKLSPEIKDVKDSSTASIIPEDQKIETNFSLARADGLVKVNIKFNNGIPFYAVFCRNDVWYVTLSYPTQNTFGDWKETEFPELTSVDTLSNKKGFSYRLHFNHEVYPKISFDEAHDTLTIVFDKQPPDIVDAGNISQPRNQDDPFQVKLKNAQTDVEFYDPATGEILWVICADEHNKPIQACQYPEFDMLTSYQGVAFILQDETLDYSYVRKVAEISKEGGLGNSFASSQTFDEPKSSMFSDFNQSTASETSKAVLTALATGEPKIKDGLYLLWLYLGQGLGVEASDMAEQLLTQAPDLKILPFWRSLGGLAALLRFRYQKAQDYLSFVQGEPDADFWKNSAQASQQAYSQATNLGDLVKSKSMLSDLPLILQERLRNGILEVGILTRSDPILKTYVSALPPPTLKEFRRLYEVAKTVMNLDPKQSDSAAPLKSLSATKPTSKTSILAMFEYLKFMHKAKKIEADDEIKQLEHLRYIWRGDLLEYTIAKHLAQRYLDELRYIDALPLMRKTIKYFTKEAHKDKLPEKMQQALIDYFNQKSLPVLQMLSIFQDYMSIAPDDERGDAIMVKATNILANLELYDEAIGLLKDYLSQKIHEGDNTQDRKNVIYYRMAVASVLNNKPEPSLEYLSQIKSPKGQLIDDAAILKAESYLLLKQKDKALESLTDTPAQLFHKAGIYFGEKDWTEAAKVYEEICFHSTGVPDHIKEQSILNLGLCYVITGDQKALAVYKARFGPFMEKRKGQQTFKFLTEPDAHVSLTHLTSLQQVTSFTDRLKDVFSDAKPNP